MGDAGSSASVKVMVELSTKGGDAGGVSRPARFLPTEVALAKLGMLSIREMVGELKTEGTGGQFGIIGGARGNREDDGDETADVTR
jgi:hypothetical protein